MPILAILFQTSTKKSTKKAQPNSPLLPQSEYVEPSPNETDLKREKKERIN